MKGQRLPSLFFFSPNNQYFIAKGEQEFIHNWKFNTKYITEFHKIYWCQPIWQQQFSLDQNLLIWQIDKSKIFILNLEKISKQKQLPFQSDSKIQSRTIYFQQTSLQEAIHQNHILLISGQLKKIKNSQFIF
ncbi:unnamed protein product [Paramecium primaurelia]|uniref:Uncharacterized protein n=1 Tax=Paramecium primaurelia TaxID=5886 RepID=A0A8S1JVH6_PARPR|nr:unnamed protein product [Paramecium primaurelia]